MTIVFPDLFASLAKWVEGVIQQELSRMFLALQCECPWVPSLRGKPTDWAFLWMWNTLFNDFTSAAQSKDDAERGSGAALSDPKDPEFCARHCCVFIDSVPNFSEGDFIVLPSLFWGLLHYAQATSVWSVFQLSHNGRTSNAYLSSLSLWDKASIGIVTQWTEFPPMVIVFLEQNTSHKTYLSSLLPECAEPLEVRDNDLPNMVFPERLQK